MALGSYHNLALKNNGTVIGWGTNWEGAATVPSNLTGVTAIAVSPLHSLALTSDGTVRAWGADWSGQSTVPAGLSGVTAISAAYQHSLVLKNNRTIAAWGYGGFGALSIPAGLTNVTAIAASELHSLALKSDGTMVAWGDTTYYNGAVVIPSALNNNIAAISINEPYSLALKRDGTVVGWGYGDHGQLAIPSGLNNVTAIAAGVYHAVALKSDGKVVGWGENAYGQISIPSELNSVTAISAGGDQTWVRSMTKPKSFTVSMANAARTFNGQAQTLFASTSLSGAPVTKKTYGGSFDAPVNAGTYTVIAESKVWGYAPVSATATMLIKPASQVIGGFSEIVARTIGDAPFSITGVTGGASGQPVIFTSSNPAVVTVKGNLVTITGVGTATITATQAGTNNYLSAQKIVRTVLVRSAPLSTAIAINFQLGAAPVPAYQTYWVDSGLAYGSRTFPNGTAIRSYGWNVDHTTYTRDRNKIVDQRLDTFCYFRAAAKWELALPNGQYDVVVSTGDAAYESVSTISVEGIPFWSAHILAAGKFASEGKRVMVADGKLTVSNGSAADKVSKINYIIITPLTGFAVLPSTKDILATGVNVR